jgi:hypothetical protein
LIDRQCIIKFLQEGGRNAGLAKIQIEPIDLIN